MFNTKPRFLNVHLSDKPSIAVDKKQRNFTLLCSCFTHHHNLTFDNLNLITKKENVVTNKWLLENVSFELSARIKVQESLNALSFHRRLLILFFLIRALDPIR